MGEWLEEAQPFILFVAHQTFSGIRGGNYTWGDAVVDGKMGFLLALKKAAPDKVKSSYFYTYIRTTILSQFITQLFPTHVPTSKAWAYWKYYTSTNSLLSDLGREPTTSEIIEQSAKHNKVALTEGDVMMARTLHPRTVNVDETCITKDDGKLDAFYLASRGVPHALNTLATFGLIESTGKKATREELEQYRMNVREQYEH